MSKKRNSSRPQQRRAMQAPLPSSAADRSSPRSVRTIPTGDQQKQIQELIDLLKRNRLTELEWECESFRVRLRHDTEPRALATPVPEAVRPASATQVETGPPPDLTQAAHMVTITSPIVGTFYRSPAPDADPYVEDNDMVKKGQVLCIVEAMKLMNEIESEVDGRIVKVLAESAKPVEYGQALFLIDPTARP